MTRNLFTDLPENRHDKLLTTLLKAASIRIVGSVIRAIVGAAFGAFAGA